MTGIAALNPMNGAQKQVVPDLIAQAKTLLPRNTSLA